MFAVAMGIAQAIVDGRSGLIGRRLEGESVLVLFHPAG
jgi:hypothetical protein